MINRLLGLSVVLSYVALSSLFAQAGGLTKPNPCESVGRVILTKDSGIPPESELCKDGQIIVNENKVYIGCLQGGRSRWLSIGRYNINELCAHQRTIDGSCWWLTNIIQCKRSTETITLVSPRSSAVSSPSSFEWKAVSGAKNYEIFVESDTGKSYRLKTPIPTVNLSDYPWKKGGFYRIRILASTQERVLSEGKFFIRVPGEQEIQELESMIRVIESSNYSKIDKIRLVDSVYMSRGLIYESIDYIELASANTKSLEITRLLAYRYSAVQDPEKATVNFEIMAAKSPEGSEDKEFAEEMLQRIALYQAKANYQ